MDSPSSSNPFETSNLKQVRRDLWKKCIFMFFTYFALICFAFIFTNIVRNGMPVVFPGAFGQQDAPFFDADFIAKSPVTLVTFEDEFGRVHRMDIDEFNEFREENPGATVRHEHRNSYSGGGILGPLVGTVLLVVIFPRAEDGLGDLDVMPFCEAAMAGLKQT